MARIIKDKTGKRYERLTVVSFAERKNNRTYWNVKCDCGEKRTVRGDKLETGEIKSCGCLWVEKRNANLLKITPGMVGWHFPGKHDE